MQGKLQGRLQREEVFRVHLPTFTFLKVYKFVKENLHV